MPKTLKGKTFLDVGCWAGGFVRYAAELEAKKAIGLDIVPNKHWDIYAKKFHAGKVFFTDWDILQSGSGTFKSDIVLCSGVLYHVSDPVGLIRKLHQVTREILILETAVTSFDPRIPVLAYCQGNSFDNNYSNWFVPNTEFLRAIAKDEGFEILDLFPVGGDRICVHLKPCVFTSKKRLPRREDLMKS